MAATFRETAEARVAGNTIPATAGSIITKNEYGIDFLFPGYIVQSATITQSVNEDITQDQKNAIVSRLDLDHIYDATVEVIGGSTEDGTLSASGGNIEVGDIAYNFAGHAWKVVGITYNGSFQDKKRYTVTLQRSTNFPPES